MRDESKVSRVVAAAMVIIVWLGPFCLLGFGAWMSSGVDEEWQGWSHFFLNPYIIVPFILLGTISLLFLRFLFRKAR